MALALVAVLGTSLALTGEDDKGHVLRVAGDGEHRPGGTDGDGEGTTGGTTTSTTSNNWTRPDGPSTTTTTAYNVLDHEPVPEMLRTKPGPHFVDDFIGDEHTQGRPGLDLAWADIDYAPGRDDVVFRWAVVDLDSTPEAVQVTVTYTYDGLMHSIVLQRTPGEPVRVSLYRDDCQACTVEFSKAHEEIVLHVPLQELNQSIARQSRESWDVTLSGAKPHGESPPLGPGSRIDRLELITTAIRPIAGGWGYDPERSPSGRTDTAVSEEKSSWTFPG